MHNDQIEMPDTGDAEYRSYLLRLWQAAPDGERRVMLQDVLSSEPHFFSSLEDLFAYFDAPQSRPGGGEGDNLETG